MRRRELLRLAAGGKALTWTGCREGGPEARPLVVAVAPYAVNSGFYVAQETGLFQQAGLDIEAVRARSTAEVAPLLAAGRSNVATRSVPRR